MHSCKPILYECESPSLGAQLYEHSTDPNNLYDEIGNTCWQFGWHGVVILNNMYFIISCYKGVFKYQYYESRKAATKAWDHLCARFERWYLKHNG